MSLHVITQSQRPILKLYVPELYMVYGRKDVRSTGCPAAFKLKQTALLLLVQSCGTIGMLLVPTGSLAGFKLKLLPLCAKSVRQRPKRFALATKESQGHGKAFEGVVS